MRWDGWLFLALSWGGILAVTLYCFARILLRR
jgi:hypothetical protein